MKIKILCDTHRFSYAQTIPERNEVTLELTRTRPFDAERECYLCKKAIGAAPGWKTLFNSTSYHESCIEVTE